MRWSVLWYLPDKDKIIRKKCGMDFQEALRIYTLAAKAGKEKATLRCDNFGFPPPPKFHPYSAYKVQVEKYRTPKGKIKKREIRTLVHLVPMLGANKKGIYWCPYCREFRRFQIQHAFYLDGRPIPEGDRRGGLYCPMCGISHRDMHVRRWNPIADRHYLSSGGR